jgi:hypothetical protein
LALDGTIGDWFFWGGFERDEGLINGAATYISPQPAKWIKHAMHHPLQISKLCTMPLARLGDFGLSSLKLLQRPFERRSM